MLSFCLKCRKKTESISRRVAGTNKIKLKILSKFAVCNSRNSGFIKNQEASGLLSNLELKTHLSKIPLLGDIFV